MKNADMKRNSKHPHIQVSANHLQFARESDPRKYGDSHCSLIAFAISSMVDSGMAGFSEFYFAVHWATTPRAFVSQSVYVSVSHLDSF
jgi:hypothetical protein